MKTFTTREIFGIFVALVVSLLSLGAQKAFLDISLNPSLENALLVIGWFSLLGALFFLGTVVWRERSVQRIVACIIFLPSFLFVQTWYHVVFVSCAALITYGSMKRVQSEIEERIHFRFFRSVGAGAFMFILGLSLILSSAYFSFIQTESWEELVPRFSIGEGTAAVIFKTVAYFNPEWKKLSDDGITVDGFLLSLENQKDVAPQENATFFPAETRALVEYLKRDVSEGEALSLEALTRELSLQAGRSQIATLAGRPVQGDEKIAEIFSVAIQNRLIVMLSGENAPRHLSPVVVPFVLSLLLFLTLLPVGSILGTLWISLSALFFRGALFLGWIKLEKIEQQQEVLLP